MVKRPPHWPPAARLAVPTTHAELFLGQLRSSRDRCPDSLDLGWWLGPRRRREGQTLTEALRLALACAAGSAARFITAASSNGNTASIALLTAWMSSGLRPRLILVQRRCRRPPSRQPGCQLDSKR